MVDVCRPKRLKYDHAKKQLVLELKAKVSRNLSDEIFRSLCPRKQCTKDCSCIGKGSAPPETRTLIALSVSQIRSTPRNLKQDLAYVVLSCYPCSCPCL